MDEKGWKAKAGIFLKGIAMGAADIVPGVSGGTIALISGIYERLIRALNEIDHRLWNVMKQEGVRAVWRRIDGGFLLLLILGILTSVLSLAKLLHVLLEQHPILVWAFFFGLIGASVLFVGRRAKRWHLGTVLAFVLGGGVAYWITLLSPASGVEHSFFFFLAGMIAVSAMILPGISGSFILILLGAYQAVLEAIKDLQLTILAFLGGGCVVGLLVFSKALKWMFERYHDLTIALMSGFLLGSLNKVWPWKGEGSTVDGKELPGSNISPWTYEGTMAEEPHLLGASLLCLLGIAAIYMLERNASQRGS